MTTSTLAERAAYDFDEPTRGQVIAVSRKLSSSDWIVVAEAARPGSTPDQRAALLLLVAGPLVDVLDQTDLDVLAAVAMPQTTTDTRTTVIAEVANWLSCADRWADISAGYEDLPDDDDHDPDERVCAFRLSAFQTAREAVAS